MCKSWNWIPRYPLVLVFAIYNGLRHRCSHLLHRITKEGRSVVGRVPGHEVAVTLATTTSLKLPCVEDTMAVVFDDISHSSRLLFVFKSVGDIFIRMLGIFSVIEKFVWGKSAKEESHQKDCIDEKDVSSSFLAETQNRLHFHPSLLKGIIL